LTGQYPVGVADWGSSGAWWLSSPWGQFRTKSVSFSSASITSSSVTFLSPRQLIQFDAYNGGTTATTITVTCTGQLPVTVNLGAGAVQTIATGWTGTCTSVTFGSTNAWDTNFDNLVIQ